MARIKRILRDYGIAVGSFVLLVVIAYVNKRLSINFDLSLAVVAAVMLTAWYSGRVPAIALILTVIFVAVGGNPQFLILLTTPMGVRMMSFSSRGMERDDQSSRATRRFEIRMAR